MTAKKKHTVCTKKKFCPGMERVFTEANRKGINTLVIADLPTGKTRCVGVQYKSKERESGMLFNYCPFCGAEIQFWKDVEYIMEFKVPG